MFDSKSETTKLLSLENISACHKTISVLDAISFSVSKGEMIALIGPNGAGKSTLLQVIAGIHPVKKGSITLKNKSLTSYSRTKLSQEIAFMSQRFSPAFSYSVRETVWMGRHPYRNTAQKDELSLVVKSIQEVGLEQVMDRDIRTLSGGELQRVHFARTMVQETPLLLLDEPSSAQDYRGTYRMISALQRMVREGKTVLAVVHDLNLAVGAFPRIIALEKGKIISDANIKETIRSGVLQHLFGNIEILQKDERIMIGLHLTTEKI